MLLCSRPFRSRRIRLMCLYKLEKTVVQKTERCKAIQFSSADVKWSEVQGYMKSCKLKNCEMWALQALPSVWKYPRWTVFKSCIKIDVQRQKTLKLFVSSTRNMKAVISNSTVGHLYPTFKVDLYKTIIKVDKHSSEFTALLVKIYIMCYLLYYYIA